jgi:isochorismate synthase
LNIIFNKIKESYKRNLPFVGYRKPNSAVISAFFMKDDTLNITSEFSESGFVFAPFNREENAILFPEKNAEFISGNGLFDETFSLNDTCPNDSHSDEKEHLLLVEKALDEINKNEFKKVVVSRKEVIQLDDFNVLLTFKKILKTYTNAFVYVWFHPKVGLWFGATPETLLNISNRNFKTMSLAGTQVDDASSKVVWKKKELEEQQLVTDFIKDQLKSIATTLEIEEKETVKAGDLLHLSTKVDGVLSKDASLKELIRGLHPTPAVCGLPREKANKFINQNENYNRTFYTGFLGELNLEDKNSSLFVNLRCMRIEDKIASVFVGGGITKDSIAKKEWQETIAKTKTMKKML